MKQEVNIETELEMESMLEKIDILDIVWWTYRIKLMWLAEWMPHGKFSNEAVKTVLSGRQGNGRS